MNQQHYIYEPILTTSVKKAHYLFMTLTNDNKVKKKTLKRFKWALTDRLSKRWTFLRALILEFRFIFHKHKIYSLECDCMRVIYIWMASRLHKHKWQTLTCLTEFSSARQSLQWFCSWLYKPPRMSPLQSFPLSERTPCQTPPFPGKLPL